MQKRIVGSPLKTGLLSRVVAAAWGLLACALIAEFSGSWRTPQCAPPRSSAAATGPAATFAATSSGNGSTSGPTWQEVDALIRQPAGLHGRQVKALGGQPANMDKLLIHMTNQKAELHGVPGGMGPALFRWFAYAHTFNKSAGHSSLDLQSPVPACHFYVDHGYRILYVRNTKTAGTSISNTLGIKENPAACRGDPKYCYAKCKGRQVCMEYLWNPQQLKKAFAEYTVFTFVRNPWSRAISSWLHVHKLGMRQKCHDPFPKFAQLPSAYGAKCLVHQGACCKMRFGWVLEHIEPQSRCLFSAGGQPVVDFIGRVEHVDEDMQTLLGMINSRRPMGKEALSIPTLPRLMVGAQQLGSKEDVRQRAYAQQYMNSEALDDIRRYFHRDFSLLNFSSTIPGEDGGGTNSSSSSGAGGANSGSSGSGGLDSGSSSSGGNGGRSTVSSSSENSGEAVGSSADSSISDVATLSVVTSDPRDAAGTG